VDLGSGVRLPWTMRKQLYSLVSWCILIVCVLWLVTFFVSLAVTFLFFPLAGLLWLIVSAIAVVFWCLVQFSEVLARAECKAGRCPSCQGPVERSCLDAYFCLACDATYGVRFDCFPRNDDLKLAPQDLAMRAQYQDRAMGSVDQRDELVDETKLR
jgi:hypothetical protein